MRSFLSTIILAFGILFVSCKDNEDEKSNFTLNEEQSYVKWKGTGATVQNTGTFAIESDNIVVESGVVKGGSFTIPISSLKVLELPESPAAMLTDHLKSADFFDIATFPHAEFTITSIEPYDGKGEDVVTGANYSVTGDFKMLNKTLPVTFPAKINVSKNVLNVEGKLSIDRTKWGMNYAADPALGEHHIKPEVAIELKLVGQETK